MPYRCTEFERNRSMGRLFLCGLNILQKLCAEAEEEEGE